MSNISHKIENPFPVLATKDSPRHGLPKELTTHAIEGLKPLLQLLKHTIDEWINLDDLNSIFSDIPKW
ncbi:hypothetical protein AHAS_Ahas15G0251600 [Arachis hypogaea]